MPSNLNDHPRANETVTLSKEQFDRIVELLTPGYELARAMLAQQSASSAPEKAPE